MRGTARIRRLVGLVVCVAAASGTPAAAATDAPVAEVSELRLYSSFWENLHHFLYVSAWAARPVVAGQPRLAMPLPPSDAAVTLAPEDRAAWDAAVAFYDGHLASRDLLFDEELTRIKLALADADETLAGETPASTTPAGETSGETSRETLSDRGIDEALRATLLRAAPVYRRYWWPAHDAANRAWIADVSRRTATVAAPIIARLAKLYGVPWFTQPVRVDVVRAAQSMGAFTSIRPHPHIVVASADASYAGWAGTEMLFHESSHALIWKVHDAIDAAMKAADKRPRDLWHVVLFYIAGELTRQQLATTGVEYHPYLYANGLFERAWPAYRAPIERHVRAFVDGQISLTEMATRLAHAVP